MLALLELLCCCQAQAEEPAPFVDIGAVLRKIADLVPGVQYAAAIDASGEVLSLYLPVAGRLSALQCLSLVPQMKQAVARYASSFNATSVPSIHIQGNHTNCYIFEHLDTVAILFCDDPQNPYVSHVVYAAPVIDSATLDRAVAPLMAELHVAGRATLASLAQAEATAPLPAIICC